MVFVSFFLTIVCLIFGLLIMRSERKEKVKSRISKITGKKEELEEKVDKTKEDSLAKRLFLPIWRAFKRNFRRTMQGDKRDKLEVLLLQAGNPFGMTPVEFRLLQITLFIALPLLFSGYGMLIGATLGMKILLGLVGFGIAMFLPKFYVKQKIKTRYHLALRELPDVIDLLTVSLEAGLGFDSALARVVSKKEGVLATEFHRSLEELRLGKTRREALTGIKDRLHFDEMKFLISNIIQAEKLGIGMVQVLKIQSVEIRDQRKQRAEEAAMKAPIKMLFPLVIFIFPSLFIVLLGPAAIQFIQTFNQ